MQPQMNNGMDKLSILLKYAIWCDLGLPKHTLERSADFLWEEVMAPSYVLAYYIYKGKTNTRKATNAPWFCKWSPVAAPRAIESLGLNSSFPLESWLGPTEVETKKTFYN